MQGINKNPHQNRILVIGASPDHLNNNALLRSYVAEGFRELVGNDFAQEVIFSSAIASITNWQPTLVVLFGSCMPDSAAYLSIKKICDSNGIPIAFWLHDDPYEFDYSFKAQEIANWIFSNDRWATMHYAHEKTFHLPLAASPTAHYRDWQSTKEHQIFFCGAPFPNRTQLISDLSSILKKYSTLICGQGWIEQHFFIKNHAVSNKEFSDTTASSHITLNIGRHFNLANNRYQLDASTPGPRTFEAAMAGTVQLYFSDSLEVMNYFAPNHEILLFDSPASLKSQVEKIIDDPKLAKKIAQASQNRALTEHTYKNRCQDLLKYCNFL